MLLHDSRYSGLNNNQFRRKANQDVLEYIDNNTSITFADYDNWTRNSSYVHSDSSDGVVDMIFMIWKGTWFSNNWRGEAGMGGGVNDSLMVDNGNTKIRFGFPSYSGPGSGVTIHDNSNSTYLMNTVKHELGHWLLGSGHPYSGSQQTRIASMLHWAEPRALSTSAPERERLGWISVPEVSPGTSSETLDDFITTGETFKYKVPGGAANEYYYITNHQNISMYDDATVNDDDKGIFILHDRNSHTNSSSNRYLLSDGDWNWENVGETINPWGSGTSTIPAFERKEVDLNGQNFSTMMPVDGEGFAWLYALVDPQSADTVVASHFRGVNMKSSFSIDNQAKFSQLTNPKPTTWNESSVPFAMKITSEFLGMVALQFNTNDDPYTITENTTWDG